jgi:LPXTG-site transpeptidase (sortase) family protein
MIKKVFIITISTFIIAMILLNLGVVMYEAKHLMGILIPNHEKKEAYTLPLSQAFAYELPISLERGQVYQQPTPATSTPKPVVAKTPTPKVAGTKAPTPAPQAYTLEVPALGINAPIIIEPSTTQGAIYKQLEKGVVHYGSSPLPGDYGTAIILGHSSSPQFYKGSYATVFAGLSKLAEGNEIKITRNGETFTYKITKTLTFSPKTVSDYELGEFSFTNTKSIILMSCWPVGTNYKRVAVKADLVQ